MQNASFQGCLPKGQQPVPLDPKIPRSSAKTSPSLHTLIPLSSPCHVRFHQKRYFSSNCDSFAPCFTACLRQQERHECTQLLKKCADNFFFLVVQQLSNVVSCGRCPKASRGDGYHIQSSAAALVFLLPSAPYMNKKKTCLHFYFFVRGQESLFCYMQTNTGLCKR